MLYKFIKFCIVGGTGAVVTWGITYLLTEVAHYWYMQSLIIATFIAMVWNFTWNYKWTFKEKGNPNKADYEWESFNNGNPVQKWWKQSIAKTVWSWIPDESSLLNIGCGSSPIATKYSHSVNMDMNDEKLAFMKKQMPFAVFEKGDACHLKYCNDSFDHVICIELIEHSSYPERVISEISRVLKYGGDCVIATPDYSKMLWHIVEQFTPYKEWHGAKLTKTAVDSICRENGLQLRDSKYVAGCDYLGYFVKGN